MSKPHNQDGPNHRKVAFRVDASLQIGSGHVMRCMTLAAALREQGMECHFICREHPGNLIDQIRHQGFAVTPLAAGNSDFLPATQEDSPLPAHAAWLGVDWQTDAEATRDALRPLSPSWLVVDHYALDRAWEQLLRSHCAQLMVVDDLADRPHDCDLLLDQSLGREVVDYVGLVPANCTILTGTRYALLRPEFAAFREYSLQRRNPPKMRQLLIAMGGVDPFDATGQVLTVLRQCSQLRDCRITVVMGAHAPWLRKVQLQAADLPWPCEVLRDVNNMAQLMADSDLAIGAAGSSSWERCVLGLPTLMVVMAKNQRDIANALEAANAVLRIDLSAPVEITKCLQLLMDRPDILSSMSAAAVQVTDGSGAQSVADMLWQGLVS